MSDPVRIRPETPQDRGPETRNDKFRRLAEKRMNKVLHGLDQLGNLSGPGYEYSEAEVERIIAALSQGVDEVERRLRRQKPQKSEFAFE